MLVRVGSLSSESVQAPPRGPGRPSASRGRRTHDVFEKEAVHALSFPLRSCRVFPKSGEVARERTDLRLAGLAQRLSRGLARPVVVVLRVGEFAQRVVPIRLQGVGYEPVVRVDAQVTPPSGLGMVMGAFDVATPQLIGLSSAGLDLGLDPEGDLEGERGDRLENELPTASSMPEPGMFVHTVVPASMYLAWQMYTGAGRPPRSL